MKTLVALILLTTGNAAMADERQTWKAAHAPQEAAKEESSGVKTFGGRQFWGDLRFLHGWRIQKNVLDGHHRLLDEQDQRIASGTFDACEAKLEEVRLREKFPAVSGKAVILIHGIGRSSKSFSGMARTLAKTGYTVVGFDYPSTRVPIPESAEYLHSVVQSLEGIQSIDVVAHSMGGLLLRAYLMKHQEPRFHRAVMLGVPNKGAQMADFLKDNPLFKVIMGPAGQQLTTGRDGLIDKLPTPKFEFGVLAGGRSAARGYNPLLPGDNDSTVTVSSTRLPGAGDFILLPVIHSFLMTDQKAIAATQSFLKSGRFAADVPPTPISRHDISVIE